MSRPRKGSLTLEERIERSVRAKRRFRAVVRLIIANLTWLQEVEDDQLGDNVKRNIQLLTRKKGKKGLLTNSDRAVLNKPQELRTEEEKHHLRRLIGNLKCFRRYPAEVKNELPGVMYFCYYGPNRTIVKQNAEGLNMYVIISGEVMVSMTYYDRMLKEEITKDLNLMGPGSYFGEVSLLHGIKRTATVTTTQPSEFLYIKREDFDRVLKATVASQWAEIQKDMACFSYFKNWSEEEIRECCILAKRKTFQPNDIILTEPKGTLRSVYFVTKGSCYLIEYMEIRTVYKQGLPFYSLIEEPLSEHDLNAAAKADLTQLRREEPSSDTTLRQSKNYIRASIWSWNKSPEHNVHFIKVCSFKKLACFNVGEKLKNRVIVAEEETECLLLPKYFLLEKSFLTFRSIEHFLNHHIPNTKKIFELSMEEKKWTTYKQKLVKDILGDKVAMSANTVHNVPYAIRLVEDVGEHVENASTSNIRLNI